MTILKFTWKIQGLFKWGFLLTQVEKTGLGPLVPILTLGVTQRLKPVPFLFPFCKHVNSGTSLTQRTS